MTHAPAVLRVTPDLQESVGTDEAVDPFDGDNHLHDAHHAGTYCGGPGRPHVCGPFPRWYIEFGERRCRQCGAELCGVCCAIADHRLLGGTIV